MPLDWAILDSLQKKADTLKPDSEIVVKLTQEQLWKALKWKLKNGAFFEYNPKENKVVIYKASDPECVAWVMFEDGENIKEAEDVCSDEIKISLDVEGLDERVAQKEQQVVQKEQQVAQKEQQVSIEKKRLASINSEQIFVDSINDFLREVLFIIDNKKLTDKEVLVLENYIDKIEIWLKWMKEKMFLSMTNNERKSRIDTLKKILWFIDSIKNYDKKESKRLDKIKKRVENMIKELSSAVWQKQK